MPTDQRALAALAVTAALALGGCGKKEATASGPPPTPVTVATVQKQRIEVTQASVGEIDSRNAPFVAAEVPGRVIEIYVDAGSAVRKGQPLARLDGQDQRIALLTARAEFMRIQAQYDNQAKQVERYQKLLGEHFVSQAAIDKETSQLSVYREQRASAQAQLDGAQRNVDKTVIRAPLSGRVEQRFIAVGDYATPGKNAFQIATSHAFRVHLPFPETTAQDFRIGLPVKLSSPAAPGKVVTGRISDIRPMISGDARSLDVIVDIANPGTWRSGASIDARVIVATRESLAVPQTSVVLRPAGEVVYVIGADNKARARTVKTGAREGDVVEILSGLNAGERVAVSGAGFLTDNAPVTVTAPAAAAQPAAGPAQ